MAKVMELTDNKRAITGKYEFCDWIPQMQRFQNLLVVIDHHEDLSQPHIKIGGGIHALRPSVAALSTIMCTS